MTIRKTLKPGDKCPAVALIQIVLVLTRFMPSRRTMIDDKFDEQTRIGVIKFQKLAIDHRYTGVVADGVVNQPTLDAIAGVLELDLRALPDNFWPQQDAEMNRAEGLGEHPHGI